MSENNENIQSYSLGLTVQSKASLDFEKPLIDPNSAWCLSVLQEVVLAALNERPDLERPSREPFEDQVRRNWVMNDTISLHDGWIILLALERNPVLRDVDGLVDVQA